MAEKHHKHIHLHPYNTKHDWAVLFLLAPPLAFALMLAIWLAFQK